MSAADAISHSYGGLGLSVHEQIAFKNAAAKTHIEEKLSHCPVFWGKIQGNDRDYVIAVHHSMSFGQIRKQFYVYKYVRACSKSQCDLNARLFASVRRVCKKRKRNETSKILMMLMFVSFLIHL